MALQIGFLSRQLITNTTCVHEYMFPMEIHLFQLCQRDMPPRLDDVLLDLSGQFI
jgi:hypothetical protein